MKILITGANRGIGLALVQEYVNRGAQVFATCRSPEQANALATLRSKHRDQVIILPLEVTDQVQIDGCFDRVRQHTTSLDRLINNAGILRPVESFRDITESAL